MDDFSNDSGAQLGICFILIIKTYSNRLSRFSAIKHFVAISFKVHSSWVCWGTLKFKKIGMVLIQKSSGYACIILKVSLWFTGFIKDDIQFFREGALLLIHFVYIFMYLIVSNSRWALLYHRIPYNTFRVMWNINLFLRPSYWKKGNLTALGIGTSFCYYQKDKKCTWITLSGTV